MTTVIPVFGLSGMSGHVTSVYLRFQVSKCDVIRNCFNLAVTDTHALSISIVFIGHWRS